MRLVSSPVFIPDRNSKFRNGGEYLRVIFAAMTMLLRSKLSNRSPATLTVDLMVILIVLSSGTSLLVTRIARTVHRSPNNSSLDITFN